MTTTDRTAFATGLHTLADAIKANGSMPLPYHGATTPLTWFVHDNLERALAVRALMNGAVTQRDATDLVFPVSIRGNIAGVSVMVHIAARVAYTGEPPAAVLPACDPRLGLDEVTALHVVGGASWADDQIEPS